MSKKKNTETALVTVSKCARMLTESGTPITRQGLTKYVKHHGLIAENRPNGWIMVDYQQIEFRRQDFTREVMRGEHSTTAAPKSKNKPAPATASKKSAPSLALVKDGDTPEPATSLDKARDAKTRKENALADAAELTLYERTNDVLATAEVEILLGLLMTLLKESLLGVNLSDDTEELLQVLNLPDEMRAPTKAVLKSRRRSLMSNFGDLAKTEMTRLDPDHSGELPNRIKKIIRATQIDRDKFLKSKIQRKTSDA